MLVQTTQSELILWSSLDHSSILPFIGACFFPLNGSETLFSLVSPWMSNGTISEYVRNHPNIERIPLMIDVAQGLAYLHSMGIVHGDLKGGNVFITDEKRAVLAYFGLSRLEGLDDVFTNSSVQSSTTHNLRGTVHFMAPEFL
ncbi:kinase-like protein, partial [Sistotremastrum suecicum HHB10207 ss-3]